MTDPELDAELDSGVETAPPAASLREVVERSDVLVCCGSGGVGKTTSAAVIAMDAARCGRRVVVVTIDPARRLSDALGLESGLSAEPQRIDLDQDVHVEGEMWAMMLDTAATFDGLVRTYADDEEQIERILTNGFYRNMASAMSGTQEYMAAETLHALHHDDRFDLVVVDTPPSRNALDFLDAPGVLSRFLDHRIFKLAMLPTRSGLKVLGSAAQPIFKAIGKVVGSDVLADSLAFFQAFSGMETGFRERADDVVALLRADRTSFVVVASPRRDTITEAVWFARQLADQGVGVAAAIVNRVQPEFGEIEEPARATDGDDVLSSLWANVAELRAVRTAELAALAPLVELTEPAPVQVVPLLGDDVHDLDTLEQLGHHLFPAT
ncbi:ArsA family ATPase [Ilumatobacter nonamiensis]|uniref:ArsA family ATPase n=1 Tax=Ilumatobacter nonamiensis TaxID=467093 RepID=UPI000344BBCE|nr:ArsA-related P-loop ATPase [Ilumatobacter nonamiensis]